MTTPIYTGVVSGRMIKLEQHPGLPAGATVEVVVRPKHAPRVAAGGDGSHPMSSQRPMSPEERAELERVYQDRGCGVECDE